MIVNSYDYPFFLNSQNDVFAGLHSERQSPVPWRQGTQHCQFFTPCLGAGVPDSCHEERL